MSTLISINLKVENPRITKNFKASEFQCKDGSNMVFLDLDLIEKLQALRDYFGKPVKIYSGYRTAAYNSKVGGANNSQHLHGRAADVQIEGVPPIEVCRAMERLGFSGIGFYKAFSHGDVRPGAKAFWNSTGGNEVRVVSFLDS